MKDRILIIGGAIFLSSIFILVFLAGETGSLHLIMALCLTVVTSLFAALAIYLRAIQQNTIKKLTHELIDITHSLEERDYSNHPADTQEFFGALAMVKQTFVQREQLRKEILDIAHYVALNMDFDKTLAELVPKLADLTKSNCCAFYTVNNASKLMLKHSIGFGKNIYNEFDLTIGEGFIGHLALQKDVTVVYDVPDNTIYTVRTFLGKIKPRNLMVVPILHQEELNGVLVCASIKSYNEEDLALVEMIKYYLGVAMGNGINAEKNQRLANELAFQNKLIQNQHEEMRKRLRDKEVLVRHLANMVGEDIAYVLDADFKVLHWNKSAKTAYSATKEEALGKKIDHIHRQFGFGPIERTLQDMAEQGNMEHHAWITDEEDNRFSVQFSLLSDEGPLGIVAKIMQFDNN